MSETPVEATPYCTAADLVVGNVPLPSGADVNKYIKDAAGEMDSILGSVYTTPVIPDPEVANSHVAVLTLRRINAHLASGRLLVAVTAGGEDDSVHAYGLMLINQSLEALHQLATGNPELYGAPKLDTFTESKSRGMVYNVDEYSQVETFYGMATPGGIMPPPSYPTYPVYSGG